MDGLEALRRERLGRHGGKRLHSVQRDESNSFVLKQKRRHSRAYGKGPKETDQRTSDVLLRVCYEVYISSSSSTAEGWNRLI